MVDRSVGFGWNCGPVFQETLGALYHTGNDRDPGDQFHRRAAGADITDEHFARAIALHARQRTAGERPDEPVWLNEND